MARILIVAHPEDLHGQLVRRALIGRGCTVSFLHVARLARHAVASFRAGAWCEASVRDGDVRIDLEKIDAVWYRRQGRPQLPAEMTDDEDRRFAKREWEQCLDGMMLTLEARFVNALDAQRAAVKPRQLRVAARAGLRVPDTLVTSDPAAAAAFIDLYAGRVVHKAMSAPRHQFADTRRWHERDRALLADLVAAPTVFQEEVTGGSDVRATVVGDRIFAARIVSSSAVVDSRLRADARFERWELPDPVAHAVTQTMRALGLVFGTVDLKVTDEDDYVFLEVNPQGQFLYVEMLTGLPITDALAELLAT